MEDTSQEKKSQNFEIRLTKTVQHDQFAVTGEIVQSGYKLYGLHGYTHEADTGVFIKRKSSFVQVTDESKIGYLKGNKKYMCDKDAWP